MSTVWKIVSIPLLAVGFVVIAPAYIAMSMLEREYYGDETTDE